MAGNGRPEEARREGEFAAIAQAIAPVGCIMAVYCIVYSIWLGLALGIFGWILFALAAVSSALTFAKGLKHMRHSRKFKACISDEGKRIDRQMGILMAISYTVMWATVIALVVLRRHKFIMSAATLITGTHFLPQAKIMNRKIDYLTGPITILFSLVSFYFGLAADMAWPQLFALSGAGGAIATAIYGWYLIYIYRRIAEGYGIECP